ncbi:MAG TPA: TonB-dependent receptor [Bacteroidota bacterium]|nr:TonB-dependent receptor [Bacteroidota bacterium]
MKQRKAAFIPFFLCLVMLGASTQSGSAQETAKKLSEMNLDDLLNMEVTTASKKAEKTTDAPGVITTITAEEIKYFGANNISDVLERATSIQTLGSTLLPSNLSTMRGDLRTLYDNHVLLLINGKPIRDGVMGGSNEPVYAGFPVDMIERIEIIRGPGSVLYGSNAFVGVINIITKGNANQSSVTAKAGVGSFGASNGTVTGTFVSNEFKAKISTKIEDITGWNYKAMTVRPGAPAAQVNKNYGQKNLGVVTDISYKGLSFVGFYTNDAQDMVGILPYATYAGKNKLERIFLDLGYTYKFSDAWEASVSLTHNGSDLKLDDEAVAVKADHHSNSDYTGELTLNGEVAQNLNLVIGGVVDSRNKNTIVTGDAIANPYHQTYLSAFLQADYRPIELLKLIAGAQFNKPENQDADVVPRFGAIVNLSDELGVKALYSGAFRSPWPAEQLLVNPAVVGNPNLAPEKISTLDIQLFYSTKNTEASIAYYNSAYTNSITRSPIAGRPGVVTYTNFGDLHMNGFEFEGKASVSSSAFITANATIQNNADESTVAVYIPNFMGKIGAFYKTRFGVTAGIYNTYFGKPKANAGAALNPAAKAVDLVSLNVAYTLPISLPVELNLYVKNLLNSDYNYPEFNRGWINTLPIAPGTEVYASARLTF